MGVVVSAVASGIVQNVQADLKAQGEKEGKAEKEEKEEKEGKEEKEEKEEGVRAAAGKQTCSCEPAVENQSTGTQTYTAFEKDGNGSHGQWTFYQ